jgi:hypothetical protein
MFGWLGINKEYEMGSTCNTHGSMKNYYKVLIEKPEKMRPLGRHRCRWRDNIRMELKEIMRGGKLD